MIKITDNYAVKADTRCFTICKKGKRKGKVTWDPEFYFTSLDHVFQKLISLAMVEGINKGSWEAVAKEVFEIKSLIKDKMNVLTSLETPPSTSGNDREATK